MNLEELSSKPGHIVPQKNQQPSQLQATYSQKNQYIRNNELNLLVEKILVDQSVQEQLARKPILQKTFTIKLNDKKLYNTRWISRLEQIAQPFINPQQIVSSLAQLETLSKINPKQSNNSYYQQNQTSENKKATQQFKQKYQFYLTRTSTITYPISLELKYPPHLKAQLTSQQQQQNQPKQDNKQQQSHQTKIIQPQLNQKEQRNNYQSLSYLNQPTATIQQEDIQLVINYHTNNNQIVKFIEQPLDEAKYQSAEFNITSYLTHSQVLRISANYPNFWNYVSSKALNELFVVRKLNLDDVLLESKVQHITLLEKINAFRKYFNLQKNKKDVKKNNNNKIQKQLKQETLQSFTTSQKYQLHGKKQLLQQLWDLYGYDSKKNNHHQKLQKLQKSYDGNISFTTRLAQNKNDTSKSFQILKFVQFVPSLSINQNNYSKFIGQFTELKKIYFNGMSVGLKGFRISNFTTRSENNITFVFQDYHQLPMLQALLIDFQFPLQFFQQLQKQYEQCPKKKIKKLRIKVGNQGDTKPWVQDMFQKPSTNSLPQQNKKNMSFSIVDNITMIKPSQPRLLQNRQKNFTNTSSANSSFFLNPMGYCQNPTPPQIQGFKSKQISFCRIDKQNPEYEKLIMYLNSITQVSKTVIIEFQKLFDLFQYKNKLTSLINVCCNFQAADLQLLPQTLEIVKVHEDHKTNMVSIKNHVQELLENQDKFACINLPNTHLRINSINCFNIIKLNQEYHSRMSLFKRIKEKYSLINQQSRIYNQQFQQSISTVQLILPNQKTKNEFVCFPFHNKTFKIIKYFEPGSNNLLELQLKQTNQRSQNFIPSQQTTFNQYKQRMIKQGMDFFYFSYPFGQKFKLNLQQNNIYSLGVKNEIKFRKQDHLKVMYWLSKINRIQYKLVFYQQKRQQSRRQEYVRSFVKQKLPAFEQLYEFGFVQESLKQKIAQVQVYAGHNKKNHKPNHLVFKKSIQKFLLNYSGHDRNSKNQKVQAYKILTNRSTWDFILKKLKTICDDKEKQLRRIFVSEKDDLEFQIIKESLKSIKR